MPYTTLQRYIATVLLCSMSLQSCQSRLHVTEESAPTAPLASAAGELLASTQVLPTPTAASPSQIVSLPLRTTPQPTASETAQTSEVLSTSHTAAPEAKEDRKPAARRTPGPLVLHRNEIPEERRNRTEEESRQRKIRKERLQEAIETGSSLLLSLSTQAADPPIVEQLFQDL